MLIISTLTCRSLFSSVTIQPHTPFLVKYWWGLPLIVVFGLAMVVADLGISYYALRGWAGFGVNLIPVMYLLGLYLIGTRCIHYHYPSSSLSSLPQIALSSSLFISSLLSSYLLWLSCKIRSVVKEVTDRHVSNVGVLQEAVGRARLMRRYIRSCHHQATSN